MEKLIDLYSFPVRPVLERLLEDKTTKQNIIFATDAYAEIGEGLKETDHITLEKLYGFSQQIQLKPRVEKAAQEQLLRTRKKAEVFTPSWIVNKMNNHCDTEWFGRPNVFNTEDGQTWTTNSEPIVFEGEKTWQKYVDSKRLEITCGEAPFIVSRYDAATGEIIPIKNRIGILDRKLRVVNENAASDTEWLKWTQRAFESSYGYEFQGDNLLIARINVLLTFTEYYEARFHEKPDVKLLRKYANIICWNFWQMDGITGTIPFATPETENKNEVEQLSFFDMFNIAEETHEQTEKEDNAPICRVMYWRNLKEPVSYDSIRGGNKDMKWDFAIGNPPYQVTSNGDKPSDESVYNFFMDAAYSVSDKTELITPARFLFNAGATPKDWNEKMLNDPHFKVLEYNADSASVFSNTDIKGGIAIHYRDAKKTFEPIKTFTSFNELNSILKKVISLSSYSLMDYIYNQNKFNLEELYEDFPKLKHVISSDGNEKRLTSGCISYDCFTDEKKSKDDIAILGLVNNKRKYRYVSMKYIDAKHENLFKYKVILPANNGSGAIGEVLSTPLIGEPLIGFTQTFISIGSFDDEETASNCLKYVKSKFMRTMLGVLKVTQNGKKPVWKYVPLQDFTPQSDINWNTSIANIDKQLYKKYGLSQEEIDFIETHVKEME
jgi:hypothetical protein